MIYVNTALVQWSSKEQHKLETSVFGADFVVMKQSKDVLQGLTFKLRMMGTPIFILSCIYGDDKSVVHNTSRPESVLRKKAIQFVIT